LVVRQELGGDRPPDLRRDLPLGRGRPARGHPRPRELLHHRPRAPGTGESGRAHAHLAGGPRASSFSEGGALTGVVLLRRAASRRRSIAIHRLSPRVRRWVTAHDLLTPPLALFEFPCLWRAHRWRFFQRLLPTRSTT